MLPAGAILLDDPGALAGTAPGGGAGPAVALRAAGRAGEEQFYRALAREMRLPYLESRAITVGSGSRVPDSILAGTLPLAETADGPRSALAPKGDALLALLGARNRNISGRAIVTPSSLREAVLAAHGATIAEAAAEDLARRDPDLCYRGGLTSRQIATLAALALVTVAALVLFTAAAAIVLSLLVSIPFLMLTALRIRAAAIAAPVQPPQRCPRAADDTLPVYTIIVPLYREGRVLPRLTKALQALDYPPAKLDIKLVVEADDSEMAQALAGTALPTCFEIVRAPAGHPRTKPRALNVALPLARGEHVVVYDAEDVPNPGQLRLAVAAFARLAPEAACLQARLTIDNTGDGLITRLFTIEYAALFDVVNPALCAMDCPLPLGGTSNHFRTGALREAGAWDAWNVTEDADLGIRLALLGHRVADLPSSTLEEAPAALRAWMHQRTRWMKGLVQVCITHSRHPLALWARLGPRRFLCALAVTFGTVLSALLFPVLSALCAYDLLAGGMLQPGSALETALTLVGATLFIAGLAAMIVPALEALRRRGWRSLRPYVALLPVYYVLVSWAAWRGLFELLRKPSHWNKTEHGLARTSRSGLLAAAPGETRRCPTGEPALAADYR